MAKKQSMTERVLNELRNDIINWNYNENDMITEAEISQKFGVSKTPSREALNYLCMEGFLEKIPNKGYLVKGISVMELQSLFQYRGILEKACAEMAIQYATADEGRGQYISGIQRDEYGFSHVRGIFIPQQVSGVCIGECAQQPTKGLCPGVEELRRQGASGGTHGAGGGADQAGCGAGKAVCGKRAGRCGIPYLLSGHKRLLRIGKRGDEDETDQSIAVV